MEDDEGLREIIFELFNDEFEIITTESPEFTLGLCQNDDIAIVMADHHMQPTKGTEVLETIYQNYPTIRRILITGDKSTDLMVEAINQSHIHGVYHKPLNFSQLREDLRNYLEDYKKSNQNEKQKEILIDEVVKLREKLYNENNKYYNLLDLSSIIPEKDFKQNISNTFLQNMKQLNNYWDDSKSRSIEMSSINSIIEEMSLISTEFKAWCFNNWLDLIKYILKNIQNTELNTDELIMIRENINEKSHPECKIELNRIIIDIANIVHEDTDIQKEKLNSLMTQASKQSLKALESRQIITLDDNFIDELYSNLGYMLVIVNQVTAYHKTFNPKNELHPSLIGNLAMALTDFSKELFEESFEVQSFEQQNGLILIHRADQNIYYVSMAYKEYKFYEIWLKEFARRTVEFFKSKSEDLSFSSNEVETIDNVLDEIIKADQSLNQS